MKFFWRNRLYNSLNLRNTFQQSSTAPTNRSLVNYWRKHKFQFKVNFWVKSTVSQPAMFSNFNAFYGKGGGVGEEGVFSLLCSRSVFKRQRILPWQDSDFHKEWKNQYNAQRCERHRTTTLFLLWVLKKKDLKWFQYFSLAIFQIIFKKLCLFRY